MASSDCNCNFDFTHLPIRSVLGLRKELDSRVTQSALRQELLNRVTTTQMAQAIYAAMALPVPETILAGRVLTFTNRPAGAAILAYKYTGYAARKHIRKIPYARTRTAMIASTENVELNWVSDTMATVHMSVTVDGQSPSDFTQRTPRERVFLKDQTNPAEIGLYDIDYAEGDVVQISTSFAIVDSTPIPPNYDWSSVTVVAGDVNAGRTFVNPNSGSVAFVTLEESGLRVYSDHVGKRYRQFEALEDTDAITMVPGDKYVVDNFYMFCYSVAGGYRSDFTRPIRTAAIGAWMYS